jgi:Tfp pilus assembly protein PilF
VTAPETAPAPRATGVPSSVLPKPVAARSPGKGVWLASIALALVIVAGAGYTWYAVWGLSPAPAIARAPVPRPVSVAAPAMEPVAAKAPGMPTDLAPISTSTPTKAAPVGKPVPTALGKEQPAEPSMLQASRPADRARIAPEVAAGYAALRAGDLATARREYSAALAADSSNLDATLGLATVEARSGKAGAAASLYRRAQDFDPRNATALAGLAALSGGARGESLEQQLQRDLAQHPESAALHFMLGNLYASQSLWTQAQAAYFEAHRLDSSNPDILHNLAVSLDRLGQPKVAATFYRRALDSAKLQASQLDADAVSRRLAEIEAKQ